MVPDNLRSAVSKAHRYETDINPSLAGHYRRAVVAALGCWILVALRNCRCFSLDEHNTAIAVLLERINRRPFRKLQFPGNRHSMP